MTASKKALCNYIKTSLDYGRVYRRTRTIRQTMFKEEKKNVKWETLVTVNIKTGNVCANGGIYLCGHSIHPMTFSSRNCNDEKLKKKFETYISNAKKKRISTLEGQEQVKEYAKKWNAAHKEEKKEYNRKYNLRNRALILADKKAKYEANKLKK